MAQHDLTPTVKPPDCVHTEYCGDLCAGCQRAFDAAWLTTADADAAEDVEPGFDIEGVQTWEGTATPTGE
jgi:hypothetical protein